MPKFPTYESRNVPDVGRAPRINASAFGAPGRALMQLGNTLSSLEAHVNQRQENDAMFKAQKQLNDLDALTYKNLQQNIEISPDGSDIFANTMEPYDQGIAKIKEHVPEKLQPRFDVIASGRRKSMSNRSVSAQVGAQKRYYESNIDKAVLQSTNIVSNNPAEFENELNKLDGMIADSNLDAGRKNELRTKYLGDLESAHARGRLKSGDNPHDVVKDVRAKPAPQAYSANVNIRDITDQYRVKLKERVNPISGVVIHHTAGSSLEGAVAASNQRGTGYAYLVTPDGKAHRMIPDNMRAVHVREPGSRLRTDGGKLGNDDYIGVAYVAKDHKSITDVQRNAMQGLITQLARKYNIPGNNVVGHGEIQDGKLGGNKSHYEGRATAEAYRQRINNDQGYTAEKEGRIRYQYMTENQRKGIEKYAKTVLSGQKLELQKQLKSDIASIRTTGQTVDIDIQLAGNLLTKKEIAEHFQRRREAMYEYKAMGDLGQLSYNEMQERLHVLTPKKGDKHFDFKQNVLKDAQKRSEKIIKQRFNDPAASVEEFDNVKEARSNLNPNDPGSVQSLVTQRITAQDSIGLPESHWSTVTQREADQIMLPIMSAGENYEEALKRVYGEMQRTFGDYAPRVMKDAIRLSIKKEDRERNLLSVFDDISSETQQRQDVLQGNTETGSGSTIPFRQLVEEKSIEEERLKNAPDAPKPNKAHIEALKNNPTEEMLKEFDMKFGAGSAKKVLGY